VETRYSNHPEDSKHYTTEELRKQYLVEKIFSDDEINLTYTHVDRVIFGGIKPVNKKLALSAGKELGVAYFLERRELGLINLGGEGTVILDGEKYTLKVRDGLYVGCGKKSVEFQSTDSKNPAKFYMVSTPATTPYPTVKIDIEKAKKVPCGDMATANKRVINQYINPSVCKSCQLAMGLTELEPGSVWNTMPAHTHERRMEVYLYFNVEETEQVFHVMGQPNETRHILVKNEQAVISPSWSIHSGVGTKNYTFIWGMAGENQDFDDMDFIEIKDLK